MKTLKEELVDKILMGMTDTLTREQLDQLLRIMVTTLKDVEMVLEEGETLPSENVTGDDMLVKNFLGCKKLKGCTDTTIARYRQCIRNLHDYLSGKSFLTVTTFEIRGYLAECSTRMSTTSVNGIRLCLNSFFQWLFSEELISTNPCGKIDPMKKEKTVRPLVTQTDVIRLKDNCADLRETVLVDVLDSCGLRCMEIPTIKIKDIDFNEKLMKVHGKGKKERIVVITDECVEHMKQYIEERRKNGTLNDYLIGRIRDSHENIALRKDAVQDILKKIKARANVRHVAIHGLRHKFASDMNRRGMSMFTIQKLLGHSSVATTQIYVDSDFTNIAQEYNKYKN